jgi:hypothetical protein
MKESLRYCLGNCSYSYAFSQVRVVNSCTKGSGILTHKFASNQSYIFFRKNAIILQINSKNVPSKNTTISFHRNNRNTFIFLALATKLNLSTMIWEYIRNGLAFPV